MLTDDSPDVAQAEIAALILAEETAWNDLVALLDPLVDIEQGAQEGIAERLAGWLDPAEERDGLRGVDPLV